MKSTRIAVFLFVGAGLILAACTGGVATEAPTLAPPPEPTTVPEPTVPAWTAPEGALVSVPVAAAPALDGVADDAVWADALAVTIPVSGGANNASTEVEIRSVYSGDMVYFVATWADPTESFLRSPWVMQEDGT